MERQSTTDKGSRYEITSLLPNCNFCYKAKDVLHCVSDQTKNTFISSQNVSFVVTGKRVTILDLKVNQSPEAVNYKGNAVAIVQSTSATIIQVCYIISTI